MTAKLMGIICDAMQGNYVTGALNMASLRADSFKLAWDNKQLSLSIDEYVRLQKMIKTNDLYQRVANLNDAENFLYETKSNKNQGLRSNSDGPLSANWPKGLTLEKYKEIIKQIISGNLSSYNDSSHWQFISIVNDGKMKLNNITDDAQVYSKNNIHAFFLPTNEIH